MIGYTERNDKSQPHMGRDIPHSKEGDEVQSRSDLATIACGFIAFFLIGVTFAWDGLVRRHIRFTYLALRSDWHVRGWQAICLGALSAGAAVLCAWGLQDVLSELFVPCQGSGVCMARTVLTLPVSSWAGAVVFVAGLYQILTWSVGAFEMDGPFERVFWAPGVIYREKTIVRRVSQRLAEAGAPPLSSDDIVRASVIVRFSMGTRGLAVRRHAEAEGSSVRDGLIEMAERQIGQEMPDVGAVARRILVTTIVDYHQELAAQVAQVYPWKRPKQPLQARQDINPE
jgi:hypothetical protein